MKNRNLWTRGSRRASLCQSLTGWLEYYGTCFRLACMWLPGSTEPCTIEWDSRTSAIIPIIDIGTIAIWHKMFIMNCWWNDTEPHRGFMRKRRPDGRPLIVTIADIMGVLEQDVPNPAHTQVYQSGMSLCSKFITTSTLFEVEGRLTLCNKHVKKMVGLNQKPTVVFRGLSRVYNSTVNTSTFYSSCYRCLLLFF